MNAIKKRVTPSAPASLPKRNAKAIVSDLDTSSPIPCSLRVVGLANMGGEQGAVLFFKAKTPTGIRHFQIPVADLVIGDMKTLVTALAESGNFDLLDRKSVKAVALAMLEKAQKQQLSLLIGSGIQNVEICGIGYRAYIWGRQTYWFGKAPKHPPAVIANKKNLKQSGSLEDWQCSIGARLSGNHYAIVVVAHALAAALRRPYNQPSLTLGLVGPSSMGKTTTQNCAQSMLGPISDVWTMTGTAFGIRELLRLTPDAPVFFQDTRQFSLAELSTLIFDVADGATRLKNGTDYIGISSTMILSNERLFVHMSGSKALLMDEGIFARFHEVICDAPFGAFHEIHDAATPAEFAKQLEYDANRYYGAVWPAWISSLADNWDRVSTHYETSLPKIKKLLSDQAGDGSFLRVNNRVFDALAFSAWVGVIAVKLKILPLTRSDIIDAFSLVVRQSLDQQQGGATPHARLLISQIKGYLDEHGAQFPCFDTSWQTQSGHSLNGYLLTSKNDGELFLFFPHAFQRLFIDKFGDVAFKQLSESGYLVTSKGRGYQYQVRVRGSDKRMSFIAVKAAIRFS